MDSSSNHQQQAPNRHLSLDMGSSFHGGDPTELSNLLLSSASSNGLQWCGWDMIREPLVCLCISVFGWYGPKALLPSEEDLLSRTIPYQVTAAGDVILDFGLNDPHVEPPTVPSTSLVLSCVWVPVLFVLVVGLFKRNNLELRSSLSALLFAIGCSEGTTQLLKVFVARKRPNFYQLCGFDAVKLQCTANLSRQREAHLSFPSGHTSLSFCAMTFLVWFFLGQVGLARPANRLARKQFLACLSCTIPWGFAAAVSATRLVDHWHHPSDVLAGCLLGSTCATVCYHLWFPHVLSSCAGTPYVALFQTGNCVSSKLPSFHE